MRVDKREREREREIIYFLRAFSHKLRFYLLGAILFRRIQTQAAPIGLRRIAIAPSENNFIPFQGKLDPCVYDAAIKTTTNYFTAHYGANLPRKLSYSLAVLFFFFSFFFSTLVVRNIKRSSQFFSTISLSLFNILDIIVE